MYDIDCAQSDSDDCAQSDSDDCAQSDSDDWTQSDSDDCAQSDSDEVRCVNEGCGNRFDPTSEGFNGECDCCAALAADHVAGAHRGLQVECSFCFAEEPADGYLALATAA